MSMCKHAGEILVEGCELRHGPMQVAIEAPNGLNPTLFNDVVSHGVHHVEFDGSTMDLVGEIGRLDGIQHFVTG